MSEFADLVGISDDVAYRPPADAIGEILRPQRVVAGMMTPPSFITASIDSHSSTRLPSMTITRSPGTTPASASDVASRSDRSAISAKELGVIGLVFTDDA